MSQPGGQTGKLTIRAQMEIGDAESKLKSLGSSIDSLGTKITGVATSINKLPQSLTSLKTAADTTATSINKLPTALNAIQTSTQSGVRAVDTLKTSVTSLGGTLNTAAGSVQQFSSRVQQSMQSISTGGGLQNVQTAVTGLNTTFNAGIPSIQRYSTTLTSLGTSASSGTGGITSMNTALGQTAASANAASTSVGRSVQEYTALGSRIGGVALSTVIMTSAIDEAIGMQQALDQSNAKVAAAQRDFNSAVEEFGPSSNEAERALARLEKAQNAQTFMARNAGFAWRDIIPIAGLMATQAIEPLIKGFSKLNEVMKAGTLTSGLTSGLSKLGGVGTGIGSLLAQLGGLEGGFTKATPAVTGFTGALGSMNTAATAGTSTMGKLIPMLEGGGLAFAAIALSVNTFLLAAKDIELVMAAASGEMVKAAEKAQEAWDISKWSGTVDVIGKIFGVESEMEKAKGRLKEIETGVKLTAGEYEKFGDSIFVTTGRLGESAKGAQLAKGQYEDLGNGVVLIKGGMEALTNATDNGIPAAQELAEAHIQLNKDQQELSKGIMNDLLPGIVQTTTGGQQLSDTITNQLTPAMQNMVSPTADVAKSQTQIREEIESARSTIDGYVEDVSKQIEKSVEWAEANATLTTKLGDTNEALIEHINQTNELVGTEENATNAILKVADSLAQHRVNIDQLNEVLSTSEGQLLSYQNAIAAGDEAFLTWVQSSRDAAVEAERFDQNLQTMAGTLGQFPGYMQGTTEEYQAFITANEQGGDAAEEFADRALESWRGLVSEAEPLFSDLKSTWADIFEGTTFDKATDAVAEANEKIRQNFEQQQEDIRGVNEKMWENISSNAEGGGKKVVDVMDGVKNTTVGLFDGVDWEGLAAATTDPFVEAFNKLPMAVSDTLDETERATLVFQAKFAQVAEMAGTTFATNLEANLQFDNAIQIANQAVADMLAPFIAEHPEMAAAFQPLFDAMNKMGPGSGQAVQDVLQKLSGMPGPAGDVFTEMSDAFAEKFGGKMPGVTKTGVEGAVQELGGIQTGLSEKMVGAIQSLQRTMFEMGKKITAAIKDAINSDEIKQDENKIPEINVNTNPANTAIQLIAKSLEDLKTYLAEEENQITLIASQTNPLEPQIQLMSTSIAQAKEFLAAEENTISMIGANVNPLEGQITLAAGAPELVNKSLQENPISLVGENINPLEGQITLSTQGPSLVQQFLDQNTITMKAANTNPLAGQINLVVAAPGQVNQNLQQNTITMVASNTNPLAGQVTLVTRQPDQVNQNLAQNPITMVGANTNPLDGQVQLAVQAHQQLQNYLNQNPITMPGAQGPVGGYGGAPTGQRGAYGGPGFAKGFGPAIVNKPTMMLVGEAGPELVSVQPEPGLKMMGNIPYVRAQEGYGDPYGGYGGGGMDPGAMQDAVQQGAQEGSQQGSQQGVQEGMQQGYQQAPSNTELWGAGRFGWSPGGGMGGGGAGQYPMAPSNTEMWGAGMQYWGGGRFGTQLGGGAPPPQYPSASVPMGVNETIGFGSRPRYYTWTGGAMGTALTPSGPGLAPPPGQTQAQGQQMAGDLTKGFQQGMGGQSPVWVNQGLKAGQNMGSGTLMGFEQFMSSQQGRWNSMPNTVFRGFPAGAAHFGGLMGDAMMAAMGDVVGDAAANMIPQLYDQFGNSYARMLAEFNQAASNAGGAAAGGGGGGVGGGGGAHIPTTPRQNIPAYTGQVPASYGKPLGQSFGNAGRATILPGGYVGTGQWPPQQAGGGTPTGGGGGGGLPPPTAGGGYGGNPSAPGGPLSQPGGGYPATGGTVRGSWYGPNDPRNTVYAQGGFHGIIDKTMRFIAHANERVDISPGPRGQINREGIASAYRSEINEIVQSVRQMVDQNTGKVEHFHIYLGNEKIKEIIRKTAGTQMDRFIR